MSNIFEINTTEESDFWSTKNFENTLSSILIAAFETKITNLPGPGLTQAF